MTQPLEQLRREIFGCMSGPEMDADEMTHEYTNLYFTAIEPSRAGSLLCAPVWITDVARIGDQVMNEARAEAMKDAKRGSAGLGAPVSSSSSNKRARS